MDSDMLNAKIASSIQRVLEGYEHIKGKRRDELKEDEFWDLVVITASDDAQKMAYEEQIKLKQEKCEIPSKMPYHVIADPPGYKVGGGGSAMHVIQQLNNIYGKLLRNWRILLINAGGMSQRLPNASALGKLFSPLPRGNPILHIFDLKLALYLPFLPYMQPGFFHAACDDIVLYDLGEAPDLTFSQQGFTALAHKSSLEIGTGHGVYVLKNKENGIPDKVTEMRVCQRVLQKPSIQLMQETGAVQTAEGEDEPFVYTDSTFFFDHDVANKLLQFYNAEGPLKCELCPYGDFLQPLGPDATRDYTKNTANVAKVEPKLVETREKLYNVLFGTPINIVSMNISVFYHIGTISEFLFHICEDKVFQEQLGLKKHVLTCIDVPKKQRDIEVDVNQSSSLIGVVMQSRLQSPSSIHLRSVLEYCNFCCPIEVGPNCIVSHCEYTEGDTTLVIPPDTFIHTVPITSKTGGPQYVTVAFNTDDNIKKKLRPESCGDLPCYGTSLESITSNLQLDLPNLFPEKTEQCSLWNVKLFPAKTTMSDSFMSTLKLLLSLSSEKQSCDGQGDISCSEILYSMDDVLKIKDVTSMLAYRNKLEQITQSD